MAKKIKKKTQFIRSQSNFNIPSVRKANKLNNQMKKNNNQKHKNNSNSTKIKHLISKIKNQLSKSHYSNSIKINKNKNFHKKKIIIIIITHLYLIRFITIKTTKRKKKIKQNG
jgi:hypothetical protein